MMMVMVMMMMMMMIVVSWHFPCSFPFGVP
jgi:hypothetical protein